MPEHSTTTFGKQRLSIEDIVHIALEQGAVALTSDNQFAKKIDSAVAFLDKLLEDDGVIYGVTTGYGDSVTVKVPLDLVNELPLHLTRFHGCGMGSMFTPEQGRAILATRLASLSQGYSGVSWDMLNLLKDFLNHNIVPVIPQEGSVGASGDLTPLSYVAGAMVGERDVYYQGEIKNSLEVMKSLGLTPLKLRPKEGLAVMNGTAVMTALACLAFDRAAYLAQLTSRITALASLALKGNSHHFDDILFSVKPHPGQQQVAAWIRGDLNHVEHPRNADRLQDRYSIRCAPHVIGVLQDSLPWFRQMIENELNSANDNPIIDGEGEHVLHGGHFYGGHIAMVMDTMKTAVANLADLADRQIASLVDTRYNNGLPSNLSGSNDERRYINHGFKAVQIGASAYTAEALKLTMPASVFSRSTECHNQDKVSMGTIAARDCLRILQLTEQVIASTLLASIQGLRLRIAQGELEFTSLTADVQAMYQDISEFFPLLDEDRPLEAVLRFTVDAIQTKRWSLYA
ncbi:MULTISPECIES: HAL/PAL/TAL family ammonia-lyase [Pseudoalteromonas]|uniref:Histidine ammonia-lyase n=1 Tax=Pseudoalteromonas lipolytica TaxID=570156 RepID=A0ABY1GFH3_9GAMM|nr:MULTISPECIES: aromatic amino acid ammonia-lyase [Pseudoalteromonas]EWH05243.1 histidine ammonia-lyase [Pseudoalteromonas lipolytica SCSIO 04301]MBE0353001.1 histidine ammonia-lyase [Pseudoalteromonas lipolytica LMEB 39]MCC9661316.1 aromatic amino acid ammonia-lyase [Pseudoalteromonas sp. MB41]SFT53640.1 histidine ammonia-lyase [Pseudoalteromonas lipolytica]